MEAESDVPRLGVPRVLRVQQISVQLMEAESDARIVLIGLILVPVHPFMMDTVLLVSNICFQTMTAAKRYMLIQKKY
jgi:hypothetical protein